MLTTIRVTTGTGRASTTLAAFDAALCEAGIGNFNLIPLSSVIPTGATLVQKRPEFDEERLWGHRLYVVMAEARTDVVDAEVWAGVGWIQCPVSGRGLFVEHHGESEAEVTSLIESSLSDMRGTRPDIFGPVEFVTAGVRCEEGAVSALVSAVFTSEAW